MSWHLWVLIGGQGSRKGSTIRALTGLGAMAHGEVMLSSEEVLPIWTQIRSINEPQDAPTPTDWVQQWRNDATRLPPGARLNAIASFRIDQNFQRPYWPEDYLNAFVAADGIIESIVTLGQDVPAWVRTLGAPFASILDVTVPTNAIAHQVRRLWRLR